MHGDDYTPTTENIRAAWLANYPDEFRGQGGAAFNRWLAAHDAQKRAEWEAEQGEPEWEYECRIPPFDWKTCTDDPRFCPEGSERRRRRKPGTWLPVTNTESEGKP